MPKYKMIIETTFETASEVRAAQLTEQARLAVRKCDWKLVTDTDINTQLERQYKPREIVEFWKKEDLPRRKKGMYIESIKQDLDRGVECVTFAPVRSNKCQKSTPH